MKIEKLALIGSGNIASWLAYQLGLKGYQWVQVYSRNLDHARNIASSWGAEAITDLSQLDPTCDLYLFALKDDCYPTILAQVPFQMPLAIHTAGAISQNIFQPYAQHYGVIYPYQSINKNQLNNLEVPICIEGDTTQTTNILQEIAYKLSSNVTIVNEHQRLIMHVAAVFANNFSNALFHIGYQLLTENGLNEKLLLPIIENSCTKLKEQPPYKCQTGPAKRHDQQTIQQHLNLIKNPELLEIYQSLTQYIIKNLS